MLNIGILGASSQIARDLIVSFPAEEDAQLHLFARRPDAVLKWLASVGLSGRYLVDDYTVFGEQTFDVVINFVGAGNPAQAVAMGSNIFDITMYFDGMVLAYLQDHPTCRYLFLSSGAAYGLNFNEPATIDTPTLVAINNLPAHEWYGVAKLHAECRHRAQPDLHIVDIRVFNYFSHTQDMNSRFLMTDILRAIRDKTILKTSPDYIVRDFLHPSDFKQLILALINSPPTNTAVDCYTLAPIDKPSLLLVMRERFGLSYKVSDASASVNATGVKPYYYSLNRRAQLFGYKPKLSSIEGLLLESVKFLSRKLA